MEQKKQKEYITDEDGNRFEVRGDGILVGEDGNVLEVMR